MCEACYHDFMKIYQKEINRKNSINYISASKTNPKIHLYMTDVLHNHHVTSMQYFESKDCHYPREKGYACPCCGTCISSPLTANEKDRYSLRAKHIISHEEMSEKLASGELSASDLSQLFEYNVVNPKVIAREDTLEFEDGWREYLYFEKDWQVIPTVSHPSASPFRFKKHRQTTLVDFKHGKIQINDLTIHQFTNKKNIEARDNWHLFSKVPGYSHFAYTGDLTDTELYAIHLCFKENRLLWINLWPRTKHCAYHILPERPSQDTSFFCNHTDLMAREVSAWLCKKQLRRARTYLWGRTVLIVDFDRNFNTNVRMMYGIFQK